ncbi:caspase family protein [Trichocoleus sp. FACHB-262]|uniref:caspase family protein n=1 Tax=Trichocoleus sp. FACHB-262 TaxID=2692869 RepID=UPI001682F558|nr:caspase family protein [Trichocoleus sp. FACHB-262]MBD2124551.1 caspase family protein [Trichocoleus sp. FACHB-262]
MNIAIILAVSEYQHTGCLPGCILDGQLINRLLKETGKYSEILFISEKTNSTQVKEKLSELIQNNEGKTFDEVFFYYTGHGDFREDEFYYILSDFNVNQYRQTSLANSELDNFLRQLNPNLAIKVIDACNSGLTYIKDNDVFRKHLDESKKSFNHCYFMFSSMSDQASYQTHLLSHFTESFIHAVLKYNSTEVRYKHIIDYISDDFDRNAFQKPFFVNQASFTEIFCSVTQKLKTLISEQINGLLQDQFNNDGLKALSLVELVKKDAQRYCSEEEALEQLNTIGEFIENYSYSSDLRELYEINPDFQGDYTSISQNTKSIGKWLKDNPNNYFSKIIYKNKTADNKALSARELGQLMIRLNSPAATRTSKEKEVSGFDLTIDVPFKLIVIDLAPKYPNIDFCDCKITFVLSQVNIRFFYFYSNFKLENWEEFSYDFSSQWQTIEVEIKDTEKLKETLSNILNKLDSFAMDPIRAKYISSMESRDS